MPSAATEPGPPLAVKWPSYLNQKERLGEGYLPLHNILHEQDQNSTNSQVKDAMEPSSVEVMFEDDRRNISPGFSGLNREERIKEMDSPHHYL